ncbi:MAG: NYN domain-containing protein [Methanothermobacter sp.]|nr:NYN domain-containing protein [Methanothermobacter sp.]
MEYILDGYNLIKSSFLSQYEGRGAFYTIQMLIGLIGNYRRRHPSITFTVVFDGNPPPGCNLSYEKGIKVIFSGDISADEVIRERVEKTPEKNRVKTVVSDDRGVRDAGRLFGASVLGVSEFLGIVYPSEKKKRREEKKEVNELRIEKELKRYYRV